MSTQNPHDLRIFTIIAQIEQYLESTPRPKFGSSGGDKRQVDVNTVFDLLGDLKVTIPEDLRRANSVLREADALLDHANQDALDLVEQAQHEAELLRQQAESELADTRIAAEREFEARVSEDEVLKEVQRRSELLQQHAEYNANLVYNGAKEYADAILQDIQRYLLEYHALVGKNRDELGIATNAQPAVPAPIVPQPVALGVEPVAPAAPAQFEDEEDEAPPRRKFGLFRRREAEEEYYEEDENEAEDAFEQEEAPRRRKKRGRDEDLDLDLPE